jgi:hypothetical protein
MNLLSIQDIRDQLTPDFVVYKEFEAVCEGNAHAVTLLSHLFWWSQVTESKYPERNGWFYKTFKDLKRELGFSRRMVEKARHFLLEKRLIQTDCRYVFNRTHWLLNKECLLQLILKSKGVAEAVGTFFNPKLSNYHFDSGNFRLEKWVNLKLWNDFIAMQQEAGYKIGRKQKVKLFKPTHSCSNTTLERPTSSWQMSVSKISEPPKPYRNGIGIFPLFAPVPLTADAGNRIAIQVRFLSFAV